MCEGSSTLARSGQYTCKVFNRYLFDMVGNLPCGRIADSSWSVAGSLNEAFNHLDEIRLGMSFQ